MGIEVRLEPPDGPEGEVLVRGRCLMAGYLVASPRSTPNRKGARAIYRSACLRWVPTSRDRGQGQ